MNGPTSVNTPAISAKRPGYFLTLDGPDGAGKTTQVARLVDWLMLQGKDVVACRDPGGTVLGNRLRTLLLDHAESHVPICMRTEMLMYMASRAQLVDEVVMPALAAGKIVVSDRFLLANVVYQGYAGGLDPADVWRVGLVATGGLLPDLTLILDITAELAAARVGAPRDRMESRSASYHRRVREGFLQALETYPANYRQIDGSGDPESTALSIQNEVAHALGLCARP
jgi:dTMP kinase